MEELEAKVEELEEAKMIRNGFEFSLTNKTGRAGLQLAGS